MKKFAAILVGLLLILGGWFYFGHQPQPNPVQPTRPVFKIGVIGPFTGDAASFGKSCMNALQFSFDNAQDTKLDYKLIFEDDVFQPSKSAMAANKLINLDRVNVIVTCSAVTGSTIAAIVEKSKTPMIALYTSDTNTIKNNPHIFMIDSSPSEQGRKMVDLLQKQGVKKVAILAFQHTGAQALTENVINAAKETDIAITTHVFLPSERNFDQILENVVAEKPDMLMVLTVSPQADIIMKRLKEKQITIPVTSIDIPSLIENKSIFEGVTYVAVADGDPKMLEAYKVKYQTNNIFNVATAYDAASMIRLVVEQFYEANGRIPMGDAFVEGLHNLKTYHGAAGILTIPQDRFIAAPVAVKKIVDGKEVVVE